MIRGIGLELVQVAPYEGLLDGRGEGLEIEAFSEEELAYSRRRGRVGEHLAVRHAAKVATLKALGIADRALAREVSVTRDPSGKPHIALRRGGKVARLARDARLHLSMSHSGGYAVAMVVVEGPAQEEVEHDEGV